MTSSQWYSKSQTVPHSLLRLSVRSSNTSSLLYELKVQTHLTPNIGKESLLMYYAFYVLCVIDVTCTCMCINILLTHFLYACLVVTVTFLCTYCDRRMCCTVLVRPEYGYAYGCNTYSVIIFEPCMCMNVLGQFLCIKFVQKVASCDYFMSGLT